MLFGLGILATALLLSMVAAYYSVAGLVAIFSAATVPVIIMGGTLELGKIVATVWLHNNWKRAGLAFKMYLVPAVAFLMLLTSMGIFGYLSKAHSDQSLVSGDSVAKVAIYDEKIKIARENIDANRKALKQLDEAVDQVMGRSTDEKGADKAVAIRRGQGKERARLIADIETEQKKITSLNEERAPLAAEFRKIEAEVGPIKYIAALVYGDNPDANVLEKAVRLVIILIVAVFDPLALTLILAANKQFEWARRGTGGFVHDEENPAPVEPPKEEEPVEVKTDPNPHKPGWMFDYLNNGRAMFFQNIKPMVAPTPEPVKIEVPDDVIHAYDNERLVSANDKKVLAEPEPRVEQPDEDSEDSAIKLAVKRWKLENPHDTIKNQRNKYMRGEISELPWMKLVADNATENATHTGFGEVFPNNANRGDTFVRIDIMPNRLYKYNGSDWIVIDKNLSDSYTYDSAYIDYLIDKISTGEYDIDLLSNSERQQVEQHLNKAKQ